MDMAVKLGNDRFSFGEDADPQLLKEMSYAWGQLNLEISSLVARDGLTLRELILQKQRSPLPTTLPHSSASPTIHKKKG